MKRTLGLAIILTLAGAVGTRYGFHMLLERSVSVDHVPLRVDVLAGESFRTTAEKLEAGGLIPSALAITLWARWRGIDRQIQQGAYWFREPLSPISLVEKMRSGEATVIRVTLPEGLTAREVAMILERQGLGTESEYLELIRDPAFARSLGVLADSLEGYLFPDTYLFSPLDRAGKVLRMLVERFHGIFDSAMTAKAEASGLTLHQVVTLASLIEKETARAEERPIVAAVFRNRLRKNMPLQADPTVIYGIEHFNGNLTRHDLETPSPYNTYTVAGLPPGPIANPGRASLIAALNPADVDYLYFVARDDGSHEFNRNLSDHNRAVNRYQRHRRVSGETG